MATSERNEMSSLSPPSSVQDLHREITAILGTLGSIQSELATAAVKENERLDELGGVIPPSRKEDFRKFSQQSRSLRDKRTEGVIESVRECLKDGDISGPLRVLSTKSMVLWDRQNELQQLGELSMSNMETDEEDFDEESAEDRWVNWFFARDDSANTMTDFDNTLVRGLDTALHLSLRAAKLAQGLILNESEPDLPLLESQWLEAISEQCTLSFREYDFC